MREIRFRAWDKTFKKMNGITGFNYSYDKITIYKFTLDGEYSAMAQKEDVVLMQFTGLLDKNGVPIYEGDVVRYRYTYRSTQTHTGDNIPNGSYTEPLEPAIKTVIAEVIFKDGVFGLHGDHDSDKKMFSEDVSPLFYYINQYDEESIKDSICFRGQNVFEWRDKDNEGDLDYLLAEYKLDSLEHLIEFTSGIEVIGNIYEHKHLLKD